MNLQDKYENLIRVLNKTSEGKAFIEDIKNQSKEVETLKQENATMKEQLQATQVAVDTILMGGMQ